MATISGFPDFANSAKPLRSDLDLATQKIIEQIGGVDADGTRRNGNLDTNNVSATAGFRTGQKLEPRSVFMIDLALDSAVYQDQAITRTALPFDATLIGLGYITDGSGTLLTLTLKIFLDGEEALSVELSTALSAANLPLLWERSLFVPAGAHITWSTAHTESGTLGSERLTLWFKAPHKE
jgi:hypothetical protein